MKSASRRRRRSADFKTRRDQLNVKVRGQLDKRNEINSQVKELITEVQKHKTLRNEANGRVAELRKIRLERTNALKEIRAKLRSSVGAKVEKRTRDMPKSAILTLHFSSTRMFGDFKSKWRIGGERLWR